jgi:hypothetical protein
MKIPKWLLPVISIVVALAVGIAAVIISGRFGPTDRVETNVETGTTTTTLYGPSGYGDDDVVDLPGSAIEVSPEVGTIDVSTGLPADPDVTPLEDAVERIADGGAAGDDIPTVTDDGAAVGAAASGDEPSDAAEDPCIAADDCADGTVTGRIFALIAPPEYLVRIRAFPPDGLCDAAPTGSVNLLVFMTRPTRARVTVERVDGGGRVAQLDDFTPTDVEARWEGALADAESERDLPFLYLCFQVDDIEPGVIYRAVVNGDARDGTGASDTTEFNGSGPTHHPNLTIEPIGDGAAVAYAEHTADEQLAVRAWVLPAGAGTPNCWGTHEGETEIRWDNRSSGELTAAETGNLLIPPDDDQRTAYGFKVPEGSTIVFCANWYAGADAPSWDRVQSLYSDGAILRTTDYVLPMVTLVRVDMAPGFDIDELTVFGRTQEGMQCGGFSFDPASEATALPHVVCDLEGASTEFDVHAWSYRDVGFTGNIVIPTRVRNAGTEFNGEGTLNIGDHMCIGGCPSTNPTTRYTVPLPEVDGVSTGSATLQVSWIQGNVNGLVRPIVSDIPQRGEVVEATGGLDWATPMMDTDERMAFDRIDPTTLSGVAALHLVTDRPVEYTVSLEALRHEDCAVGGATLSVSGHSDGATDVEIPGLCLGSFYWATVELTDEYGNSTTFSASHAGVTQWLSSLIRVPSASATIDFSFSATIPADQALLPSSVATLDGVVIPMPSATCVSGTLANSGTITVPLTSHPVLHVDVAVSPVNARDGDRCTHLGEHIISLTNQTIELDLAAMRLAHGPTTIVIGQMTFVFTVRD